MAIYPARPSAQVDGLLHRIRKLVTEQRSMEQDDDDRRDAIRREMARLKWRLANAVKRDLSAGRGLQPALVSSWA